MPHLNILRAVAVRCRESRCAVRLSSQELEALRAMLRSGFLRLEGAYYSAGQFTVRFTGATTAMVAPC